LRLPCCPSTCASSRRRSCCGSICR
jgi:hypothetical protein